MNTENFVLTNNKLYNRKEANELFSKYLDEENTNILLDHVCEKDLAKSIISFTTQNGVLFLNLGNDGDLVAVKKN